MLVRSGTERGDLHRTGAADMPERVGGRTGLQEGTMMTLQKTRLEERILSGQPLLIAELAPPAGADAEAVRTCARQFAGKIHALGVSDNRDDVRMAAMAAAALVAAEGVEPILHVVTRDRNRIALASECLGAAALGIRNLLCTTGTHQTLGSCRTARNVFDIDSIQLLQMYAGRNGVTAGSAHLPGAGSFCLGATASPYSDPVELQVMRLAKKVAAGAQFLVTQPVFDVERFKVWWNEVTGRGLHEKTAVLVGIQPLAGAEAAKAYAGARPQLIIPDALLRRLEAGGDLKSQRAAGIEIATETIRQLSQLKGLRGFEIRVEDDDEAALEVIGNAGLRVD
jgi:methylenetetrahydrofolate reductase (NADH)